MDGNENKTKYIEKATVTIKCILDSCVVAFPYHMQCKAE